FLYFFSCTTPSTSRIYTLSLHDALPIWRQCRPAAQACCVRRDVASPRAAAPRHGSCAGECRASRSNRGSPCRSDGRTDRYLAARSEEHTSELQSLAYLVCRLLLEKKKKK